MPSTRGRISGFQDHVSDVGDAMARVENVSFSVQGELRRRPGLGDRIADLDATLLGSIENATDSYLIAKSGASLVRYALTGATTVSNDLSLSTTERGSIANINNVAYYANGTVYAVRDGTTTVAAAGIAAPTVSSMDAGAKTILILVENSTGKYAYKDTEIVTIPNGGYIKLTKDAFSTLYNQVSFFADDPLSPGTYRLLYRGAIPSYYFVTQSNAIIHALPTIIETPTGATSGKSAGGSLANGTWGSSIGFYKSSTGESSDQVLMSNQTMGTGSNTFTVASIPAPSDPSIDTMFIRLIGLGANVYQKSFPVATSLTISDISGYDTYSTATIPGYTSSVASSAFSVTATTSSVSCEAGTRLFRFRYYNATNNTYSDPSIALTNTTTLASYYTITSGETVPSGSVVLVEMTLANGTVFYKAASSATFPVVINQLDSVTSAQDPANAYAAPDGYGHEQPPSGITILIEHRNRLFGANPTTGWMYWSRGGYPESWRSFDWARQPLQGVQDKISGLASYFSDLYVFGQQSVRRMIYAGDPASAMLHTITTNLGVWNQNCLVQADQKVWGWGREGAWYIDGIQPKHISRPIDVSVRAEMDESKASECHGFYDPKERVVQWFFVKTGETYPRLAIAYDLMTGQWSLRRFRNTIRASCTFGDSTRRVVPYLADADAGYVWRLNGTHDGLPTTMTDGRITASAGSSTTVLNTNESLPTSPQNLIGAYLYDALNATEHRVTANLAGQVTITPALSTTPTLNQEYYLGSIDVRVVSQWHTGSDLGSSIRPSYLLFEQPGTDEVEYTIQYNVNFATSPVTLTSNLTDDRMNSGVAYKNSTTFTITNTNQSMNIPIPSDWNRAIQYDLHQLEPYGEARIFGLTFQNDPKTHVDSLTRE